MTFATKKRTFWRRSFDGARVAARWGAGETSICHPPTDEHDEKPEFEFGLDLILDGLERLRDAAQA